METKRCPNCRLTYILEDFGRNSTRKDKVQGWCRGCIRAQLRLGRQNYLPGPKRKPRKKHAHHHVYAPEYPLIMKHRLRGKPISDELLEAIVIYLDNSTFTVKEIAWRCNVNERTVLQVYRDCQRLYQEAVRKTFHNYSYEGQASHAQRRLPLLQALSKLRREYTSYKKQVTKIKELRQQRQHRKGRKRKECRKLDNPGPSKRAFPPPLR